MLLGFEDSVGAWSEFCLAVIALLGIVYNIGRAVQNGRIANSILEEFKKAFAENDNDHSLIWHAINRLTGHSQMQEYRIGNLEGKHGRSRRHDTIDEQQPEPPAEGE